MNWVIRLIKSNITASLWMPVSVTGLGIVLGFPSFKFIDSNSQMLTVLVKYFNTYTPIM